MDFGIYFKTSPSSTEPSSPIQSISATLVPSIPSSSSTSPMSSLPPTPPPYLQPPSFFQMKSYSTVTTSKSATNATLTEHEISDFSSLPSTLTDSRTLDVRTPIIV